MKQTMNKLAVAAVLGGMVLLTAGCVKESAINEKYRPAGTPITFSAATGYENGNGTRTEYSGQLYGENPKYERIDWVSDDPITIAYVHSSESVASRYAVTSVSGDTDRKSTASVDVLSGYSKLTWGEGDGDHTFYAMYPSTGFKGNSSASLTNNNHVQGSVPAEQDMHVKDGKYLPPMEYGYMVSYKQIEASSTENRVSLPFTPAVTAFEFKLQSVNETAGSLKVTGIELEATTTLTGTFAFNITGGDDNGAIWNKTTTGSNPTVLSGTGNTISMTFPVTGGVSLPAFGSDNYLDFTLFALPVEQTGLKLKFIFDDGSTNTLNLKDAGGSWHVFEAAKKHIITNKAVPDEWEYIIEATDPEIFPYLGGTKNATVTSYRQKGSTKEAVAWEVEGYYSDPDCTQPVDPAALWIDSFNGDGTGSGSVDPTETPVVAVASIPAVTETITPEAQALNALVAGTEVGSAASPRNLSNPGGNWGHGTIEESANSYIVNKVGYYEIPLVMGNSIKGNVPNPYTEAWQGHDGRENGIYKEDWRVEFENYKGNHITDPWLKNQGGTPTSAEIVWEDVEGLVETDANYNLPTGCIVDGEWLRFHIPAHRQGAGVVNDHVTGVLRDEPRQGNAVIAVKDENKKVMWTYHIWVTDYIPKNYPGYSSSSNKDADISNYFSYNKVGTYEEIFRATLRARLMGRSLGEVVYGQTITTTYPSIPTIYAKLVQEGSGKIAIVTLNQDQGVETYERDRGKPTWQFGRSGALWPFDFVNDYPEWYGKVKSFDSVQGPVSIGQSIQASSKFLINGDSHYNINPINVNEPSVPQLNMPGVLEYSSWYRNGDVPPTKSLPSNLWRADGLYQYLGNSIHYIFGGGGLEIDSDMKIVWNEWGNIWCDKTIYDPCPVGYHVPNHSIMWTMHHSRLHTNSPSQYWNDDSLNWFPGLSSHGDGKYHYFFTGPEDRVNTIRYMNSPIVNHDGKNEYISGTSLISLVNYMMNLPNGFLSCVLNFNMANDYYINPRPSTIINGLNQNSLAPILPVDEDVRFDPRVFPTTPTWHADWSEFMNNYN